jgi:hypothetical protein
MFDVDKVSLLLVLCSLLLLPREAVDRSSGLRSPPGDLKGLSHNLYGEGCDRSFGLRSPPGDLKVLSHNI